MKRVLHFGKGTVVKGNVGARAQLRIDHAGWAGAYHFFTHGMTAQQVIDRVEALTAHHAKKAARLDGFRASVGVEFVFGTDIYRLVDCNVWEIADTTNVEIYLNVRRVSGSRLERVQDFPWRQRFTSIDDIPTDAKIRQAVRARIADVVQRQTEFTNQKAAVEQLLAAAGGQS